MSSELPQLRYVGAETADTLAKLHEDCFPNYWNSSDFTDFFSISGTHALLAGYPDAQGMLVWRLHFEQAEILTLAVRPSSRRQGLARRMLQKAIADATARGATQLYLDVENGNVAALSMYESHGFTVIRRRKQYYRQKDGSYTDALVMVRELA